MNVLPETVPQDTPRLTTRSIRSFVLRQGRMSPAQVRAYEDLLPRLGIEYAPQPLDFAQVFGRQAPVVVEIGFGMGETTARIAEAMPGTNFLGLEVHAPGVGALLKLVGEKQLANVRVIRQTGRRDHVLHHFNGVGRATRGTGGLGPGPGLHREATAKRLQGEGN